jgi:hypothetical protein
MASSSSFVTRLGRRGHVLAVAALSVALSAGTATHAEVQGAVPDKHVIQFTIDVAEDLSGKFVPTFVKPEHTQPERGAFYLTEGRLFPAGTIQGDGADFNPARSGHVGVWISRGTHLVSASEIPLAQWWAHTSQLFVIGRQGRELISSEGVEGSGSLTRIVTGGAGNYVGFVGEQQTTFLGFNTTGGVNLRVTFVLRKIVR